MLSTTVPIHWGAMRSSLHSLILVKSIEGPAAITAVDAFNHCISSIGYNERDQVSEWILFRWKRTCDIGT